MASDGGKKETPGPLNRKRSRKGSQGTTEDISEISLLATMKAPAKMKPAGKGGRK